MPLLRPAPAEAIWPVLVMMIPRAKSAVATGSRRRVGAVATEARQVVSATAVAVASPGAGLVARVSPKGLVGLVARKGPGVYVVRTRRAAPAVPTASESRVR